MKKYLKNDGGMEKKSYLCTEFGVECARGTTREGRNGEKGSRKQPRGRDRREQTGRQTRYYPREQDRRGGLAVLPARAGPERRARGHTLTAHWIGESKQEGKRGTTRESRTGEGARGNSREN